MRLLNFINEDDKRDYNTFLTNNREMIVSKIKSNCSKWLSEVKHPIYRGLKNTSDIFVEKSVRKDRKPVDIPEELHKLSDKVFIELFGWKVRSEALFVAKYRGQSAAYGQNYMVFPIGSYSYVYSDDIPDYFSINRELFNGSMSLNTLSRMASEQDPKLINSLRDVIKDNYTNKGLNTSDWITGEVMINCNSYYGLQFPQHGNNKVFDQIVEEIGIEL